MTVKIGIWSNWVLKNTWIWYISKSTTFHFNSKYKFATTTCLNWNKTLCTKILYFFYQNLIIFYVFQYFHRSKEWKENFQTIWTKFQRFFHVFGIVSLWHTWNRIDLLLREKRLNVRVVSQVAKQKFLKYFSPINILTVCARKLQKITTKTVHRKTYFVILLKYFVEDFRFFFWNLKPIRKHHNNGNIYICLNSKIYSWELYFEAVNT